MKKGFMLGLLALCTSAAFAIDAAPIAPHKRTSDAKAQAASGVKKDVLMSASDRTTKSDAQATAANSATLPSLTAAPIGANNGGGMRSTLCDSPLYETGDWDGVNGLFNSRSGFGYDARCAVDADFDDTTVVAAIHWLMLDIPGMNDITAGDLLVLPDTGNCLPNDDDSTAYANVSDAPVCRVLTGEKGFGYYDNAVYTINYSVKVPAGKSWWAARPVHPSGYGYWATANSGAPLGCDSAFRSPTFGVYSWAAAQNQLGQQADFAMCLTAGGEGAGACCIDGDCKDGVNDADCRNAGGEYQGDGSFCCSTVCPGSPQACCHDDGTCENVKPRDCTGISQGDGVLCAPGLCPLPDFCADSIFNQFGYDGVNGLSSQDSGDIGWIDARVADNATLVSSSDITGAVWESIERGNPTVSVVDVEFYYTSIGGGPGKLIASNDNIAYDYRLASDAIFGGTVYVYVATTATTRVVPGSYYVMLRPRIDEFVQAFWLTAAGDGIPGYFKSPFFGINNWQSVASQLGYDADFSFCLLGASGVGPYGACCVDDESSCIITTEGECTGVWGGDDSACFPSPCRNEPGACCYEDGSCAVTKPADCTGDFKGGGTECGAGICPLPDFCGEGNLYSQFGYDGFNGLANQDSEDIGWIGAWTSDDANVINRGYATGVVVQNVTRGGEPVNYEDAFLAYDSGNGPGALLQNENDTTAFLHLTDGSSIFGGTIWVDKVDIPSTAIVPGEYYVGAREKIDQFVQSFLLTSASGGGLDSYFKSPFFGYSSWTKTSALFGSNWEFSFCLLGTVSDVEFGACCIEDESACVLVSEADCTGMGGRYVGTDVACFPAPCTNMPGACCFLDPFGCEDGLKESDCTGRGGVFQGGSTDCTIVRCPLPDFCEDAIYSQFGYDGINGGTNQDSSSLNWVESWCADDFTVSGYYEATGVVAQTIDRGTNVSSADAFISYTSGGGGPGTYLNFTDNTSSYIRATDGTTIFGGTIYVLVVDLSSATRIGSGQYYGSARPVIDEYYQSFLLTTSLGGGSEAYFKSAIFGYPNWVPVSTIFGAAYEFSLCFLGNTTDAFGACCTENDSICNLLSAAECREAGGNYGGDGTICAPNPCPNAPGACCLESGECLFVTPAGCDDENGVFQGGDVLCEQINCPIPDPCDGTHGEVLWNNSTMDLYSASTAQDSRSVGWFDSFSVDDVTFGSAVTIGGLHWYDWSSPGATNDGLGDYVITDDGGGQPGTDLALVEDLPLLRLNTGVLIYGYYQSFQNNLNDINVALAAGTYYIGGRPNITTFNQVWTGSAPLNNAPTYYRWTYNSYVWQMAFNNDLAQCLTGPTSPCSGVVLGDSDGDGDVDFDDIDCFVSALIDADTWADCGTAYPPGAYLCANDIDQSGAVDFDDIDPFVICLANDGCP